MSITECTGGATYCTGSALLLRVNKMVELVTTNRHNYKMYSKKKKKSSTYPECQTMCASIEQIVISRSLAFALPCSSSPNLKHPHSKMFRIQMVCVGEKWYFIIQIHSDSLRGCRTPYL